MSGLMEESITSNMQQLLYGTLCWGIGDAGIWQADHLVPLIAHNGDENICWPKSQVHILIQCHIEHDSLANVSTYQSL